MAGRGVDRPGLASGGLALQPARILVVDKEAFILQILVRKLTVLGYACEGCDRAERALELLAVQPYDLLLADLMMREMSGLEFMRECCRICPGIAVIMVTPVGDLETAVEALKQGAYDYITKPFSFEDVVFGVARALEKRRLILENQQYQQTLEEQVGRRSQQLKEAVKVLQDTYHSTLVALSTALDSRDADTGWHSLRVTLYTTRIARQLGIVHPDLRDIEQGALLHDIGKIGVPDGILRKPGKLTDGEWLLIRKHPEIGYRILSGAGFLRGALQIVLHHHETFDGSGYPAGLRGCEIALGARIFSVADTMDCITSERPFQPARPFEDARAEIRRGSGKQFDPEIVKAFLEIPLEEWPEIRRSVTVSMGKGRNAALLHCASLSVSHP